MRLAVKGGTAIALLASLSAQPSLAQDATPTERKLLDRVEHQDKEIEALKAQVEALTKLVSGRAGTAASATQKTASGTAPVVSEQVQALEEKVDENTNVLARRVTTVEERTQDGKVAMTTPGPRFESTNGNHSIQVVGALQVDAGFYRQGSTAPATPKLNGGTNFRRAHIGVQGTAFRDFAYTIVLDAAGTSGITSAVRDATIAYSGFRPWTIAVGNQKPQTGLETSFSDRSNASTFMEPGISSNLATATGTRNIGVRLWTGNDLYSVSAGIFGDDITNNNVAVPASEGWGSHGRFTLAPINKPGRLVHLGVSGYWRRIANGRAATTDPIVRQFRVRAQAEITVDTTRLVNTGNLNFARAAQLVGAEAAIVHGPLAFQGEYMRSFVQQVAPRTDLDFDGGYAALSWFLTGESRVYDGRAGVFQRVAPKKNFSLRGGGWGAFELAGRWSFIDLDSDPALLAAGGVRGGKETDYTLAMNWYLNPYLRLMFNYVHADVDNLTNTGAGAKGGGKADIFAIRAHQEIACSTL